MAFRDCMREAVDVGAITREEADALISRFAAHAKKQGGDLGKARASLEAEVRAQAARKKMLAQLAADKADEINAYLDAYRDPSTQQPDVTKAALGLIDNTQNALAGAPSVAGRAKALLAEAQGRMESLLHDQRRKYFSVTGQRRNLARLDNIVREAHGETTGDAAARDYLQAWRDANETVADAFRAAGGDLGKMENYFPQNHDARKLLAAGREDWKAFIKPRLDPERMKLVMPEGADSAAAVDAALTRVYDRIVTDGAVDLEPSRQIIGRGALENRRQEERFLIFKNAEAWQDYNKAFGGGDAFAAMMRHTQGLARDAAALQILGPNPAATVEWLKQIVKHEGAMAATGRPSMFAGDPNGLFTSASGALSRIDSVWTVVSGGPGVGNIAAANLSGALRNFLMSSQLAATFRTAIGGDLWQSANAARFAGIPAFRTFAALPAQMFREEAARDIARAGVLMEDANQHLLREMQGLAWHAKAYETSKYLPERVLEWTLLTPWTNVARRAAAGAAMFEAADRLGQSLAQMEASGVAGQRFARQLRGYGIDEATWARIAAAKPLDHAEAGGMLRMVDIIDAAPGDAATREAALRYSEFVHNYMEEATPTGTARARATMGAATKPGTVAGEIVRGAGMYLGFGVGVFNSLRRAIAVEMAQGRMRGAGFAMAGLAGLTLGGAIILQLAELAKGRDPRPVNDPEFWAMALAKGGGLGWFGDQIMADYKRGSMDAAVRMIGPPATFMYDIAGVIGLRAALGEDDINRAARLSRFGRTYIPVQNMWMIRPVTERLLWDRLDALADPDKHAKWRQAERKLRNDTGQGLWWGPGEAAPRRAPEWGAVWD